MSEKQRVVGLVFKYLNDIYYTDKTNGLDLGLGDLVIAKTVRSKEVGRVIQIKEATGDRGGDSFVKKIIRLATEKDFQREESNRERERKAFSIAVKKIEKLGLPMRLIRVHYLFDHSRILFYFKADGKVDFRQLVRELASVFKARIELRQIGVRDEAKILGGLATCGRPLCCSTWLRSFTPVTVRMAKDQHLSLNPNKISGVCGRLQCCLEYEQNFYEETLRNVPNMGSQVRTPAGEGKLIKANIFTGQASILLHDASIVTVPLAEVSRKSRPRQGGQRQSGKRKPRPEDNCRSGGRKRKRNDKKDCRGKAGATERGSTTDKENSSQDFDKPRSCERHGCGQAVHCSCTTSTTSSRNDRSSTGPIQGADAGTTPAVTAPADAMSGTNDGARPNSRKQPSDNRASRHRRRGTSHRDDDREEGTETRKKSSRRRRRNKKKPKHKRVAADRKMDVGPPAPQSTGGTGGDAGSRTRSTKGL